MPGTRRHKRIIKRLETECSAAGVDFRGISSDLSGSGLFVRTSKPFSPDTAVDLTIHLPDNSLSKLRGIVRRAVRTGLAYGKNGMGIEIIECDQNFVTYVNSLLPLEEQIQCKDRRSGESVDEAAESEQAVPRKNGPVAGPKNQPSPRSKRRPVVSPKGEDDETDEAVDSLLTSLFSKDDKK
jgi:hypothetical protein